MQFQFLKSNYNFHSLFYLDLIRIIKIEDAVNLRKFELPETEYQKLTNGVKVKANFDYEKDFLLFCNKQLFGIAEVKNNVIKIKTNLKE